MENESENPVSKINRKSVSSLVVGLLSIILYLPLQIDLYVIGYKGPGVPRIEIWGTIANAIPLVVYIFGGIVLGIIGLSFGADALRQIKEGNVENRSHVIAITGRVLSILGIITNVLSIPIFLVQ